MRTVRVACAKANVCGSRTRQAPPRVDGAAVLRTRLSSPSLRCYWDGQIRQTAVSSKAARRRIRLVRGVRASARLGRVAAASVWVGGRNTDPFIINTNPSVNYTRAK